jgi:hypothetical protein
MYEKVEPLQNSMPSMILYTLDEGLPKCGIGMQGNHENIE